MGEVSIMGLDLAKNVFQAHGAGSDGSVVFRRKLSRAQLLKFMAAQPPCVVAMEACASAHHWGRAIGDLGVALPLNLRHDAFGDFFPLIVRFDCHPAYASRAPLHNEVNRSKQTWLRLKGAQESNPCIVVDAGAEMAALTSGRDRAASMAARQNSLTSCLAYVHSFQVI